MTTLASAPVLAQRQSSSDGISRLEEDLGPQIDDGSIPKAALYPLVVVSLRPAFEETRTTFGAEALQALIRIAGQDNLRLCEACMQARVDVQDGRLEMNTAGLTTAEIIAMDARMRGQSPPAQAAVWLDETPVGVTVRIVSLADSRILFAANYDGTLAERSNSERTNTFSQELLRRIRGESLTHVMLDGAIGGGFNAFGLGAHLSMDILDQFGDENLNLAGLTFTLLDPLVGVGAAYYRIIPQAFNLTVGGQVVVSLPTAIAMAATQDNTIEVIDPLFTGVLVAKMPIPYTNFAGLVMLSTNGTAAVGISLMNVSFLPVLP